MGISFRVLLALVATTIGLRTGAAAGLSHAPDPLYHDSFEGIAAGPSTDGDAARFLAQATFGPTDTDITHLRAVGYQTWLTEQFAATPTYEMDYINWVSGTLHEGLGQNNRAEAWFLGALGGPDPFPADVVHTHTHTDQLRQRVAFALSEILVISDQNTELGLYGAAGMAYYYDILVRDAFGDYRKLLEEVTLSPAMGVYLNMMGNRRADLSQNVHPDENYGREINQLFSIGLVMLNPDGTPKQSGGQPIPTYTQSTITNFAHVFTGWNWSICNPDGSDFTTCHGGPYSNTPQSFLTPMVAFAAFHDNGTDLTNDIIDKQLLSYTGAANGGLLVHGGTPASDLKFALDNIYNHPNVGPFISKQLIQRLVTSNPSPAYVQRVASVFDANRGQSTQLQAVVQAILLDVEARYVSNIDTYGKLREPLLALTHLWRAMGARHVCGQNVSGNFYNNPYRYAGDTTAWATGGTQYQGLAQAPQDAFTVFNFFKPGYLPPGELATRGLLGPEFQLQTDAVISLGTNTIEGFYVGENYDVAAACDSNWLPFGQVVIDSALDYALAGSGNGGAADPSDALVDEYNKRFMSGQMSPFMRQTLINYLNTIDSGFTAPPDDWRRIRVRRALYLILTSPEYMVQK